LGYSFGWLLPYTMNVEKRFEAEDIDSARVVAERNKLDVLRGLLWPTSVRITSLEEVAEVH